MDDESTIINSINKSEIIIYPTDTIYGIGCNALDKTAVSKIKEIKNRDKHKPLSIIAPGFDWIYENLIVDFNIEKYLPGPYTIILKKKDESFLDYVSNGDSLGIRIPDNDVCRIIQKSGKPFITSSVNLSGEAFALKIEDIKKEIIDKVDLVINRGELNGKPSSLIINGKIIPR